MIYEDIAEGRLALSDPSQWVGINVPIAMPGMYCSVGQVEVLGLWHPSTVPMRAWRKVPAPVKRGWKVNAPPQGGGF